MSQTNCKLPFAILAIIHIQGGLILGFFAEDGPPSLALAAYIGLFFSQTSLLGIWAGLATLGWRIRLVGLTLGLGYLTIQICWSLHEWDVEIYLLVVGPTVVVALVMLGVRQFVALLESSSDATIPATAEGLRFSIRHLMLLTFVVSCTLAIGRLVKPYVDSADRLTFLVALSLCYVSVGVSSVWATLGRPQMGRPQMVGRSCVVLAIGLLAGCIPSFYMGEGMAWLWLTMMTIEAACLLASLYFVRLCGFRLIRHERGHNDRFTDSSPWSLPNDDTQDGAIQPGQDLSRMDSQLAVTENFLKKMSNFFAGGRLNLNDHQNQ